MPDNLLFKQLFIILYNNLILIMFRQTQQIS